LLCFWCCQAEKLKKSRRSASFVMLSTLKNKEVAELLRFWCGQLQKMRRSRRIASFLMWSTSKNEEVS
jgi:hypothetical protein